MCPSVCMCVCVCVCVCVCEGVSRGIGKCVKMGEGMSWSGGGGDAQEISIHFSMDVATHLLQSSSDEKKT